MSVTFHSKFVFCNLFFQYSVFKMERCTADDISVSYDPTISSSTEFKTKWKDTMHTLHVTHKNLLKRFVAGRSILNITIYDFFHCVVLVRVAGLRIRCFFFSDSIDCTSVYSSDLAKMAEIMGDLDMTGLSTAIRRCWSIWFSAISLLARWRLLGKQHVKLISINVIFHETNVIWQETTWCRL